MRYYVQLTAVYTADGYIEADSQEEADELAEQAWRDGLLDWEVGNAQFDVQEVE